MIGVKTQTKRSTKWEERILNANLCISGFQVGIVTSKYWGNFEERKIPLTSVPRSLIPKSYFGVR